MRFIHARIKSNLLRVFESYFAASKVPSDFQPVNEDFDEQRGRTEVLFLMAQNLWASTSVEMNTKKWSVWVYKTNKDGSISKKFPEREFELQLAPGDEEDDEKITIRLMEVLLGLERIGAYKSLLETAPLFQAIYKPAMQAALVATQPVQQVPAVRPKKVETKREDLSRSYEPPLTKDPKAIIWIVVALIVAAIIGSSTSGSQYPDNCNYIPDPRGGYVEC